MISSTDQWFDAWRGLLSNQPWQSTLEDWWRQYSLQGDGSPSPVFEKIAAQSHSFFQLAEELARLNTGNDVGSERHDSMDRMLDHLKRALNETSSNQAQNLFWQMPLANWQRFVSTLPGAANVPFAGEPGMQALDPSIRLQKMLSTPGLGYTRETQSDVQKLTRLSIEYLEAQRKYSAFYIDMSRESIDTMRDRLQERSQEGGEPMTTVREFYDLWVDCSEAVYRARTLTEEYARLNGEMVNALMALKQHGAGMMDDFAGKMNLPTRQEVDTMHRRAQETRRAAKDLEHQVWILRETGADQVRRISGLKDRVEKLPRTGSKATGKNPKGGKRAAADKAARKSGKKKSKNRKVPKKQR